MAEGCRSPAVPLSEEEIRRRVAQKVEAHRVKSLKKKLSKRGLTTGGLKKDLQRRLLDAMVVEEAEKLQEQKEMMAEQLEEEEEEDDPPIKEAKEVTTSEESQVDMSIEILDNDEQDKVEGKSQKEDVVDPVPESMETEPSVEENQKEVIDVDALSLGGDDDNDGNNTSSAAAGTKATSSPKKESGRKRVRSPVKNFVQSAIQKLSAPGNSSKSPPIQHSKKKARQMAAGVASSTRDDDSMVIQTFKGYTVNAVPVDMEVDPPRKQQPTTTENRDNATGVSGVSTKKPTEEVVAAEEPGDDPMGSTIKGPIRLFGAGGTASSTATTPWSAHAQSQAKQMSEKYSAKDAARKARMAELREKVRSSSSL